MKKTTLILALALTAVITLKSQVTLQTPSQPVETTLHATLTPTQTSNALAAIISIIKLPTNTPTSGVKHFQGIINPNGTVNLIVVVKTH